MKKQLDQIKSLQNEVWKTRFFNDYLFKYQISNISIQATLAIKNQKWKKI